MRNPQGSLRYGSQVALVLGITTDDWDMSLRGLTWPSGYGSIELVIVTIISAHNNRMVLEGPVPCLRCGGKTEGDALLCDSCADASFAEPKFFLNPILIGPSLLSRLRDQGSAAYLLG